MRSPLKRQREEILRKQREATNPSAVSGEQPKSLHLYLNEMDADLKDLKDFNRIEDKVKHKRDVLVPKYKASIEKYLEGDDLFDNPLFAQMVVWMFDIGELDTAIRWTDKAIERGLDMPERFRRDFATFCADEVLQWSEKMSAQGHAIEPYFSETFEKVKDKWRINEKLTSKWFKFAGLFLLRDENGKPLASSVGNIETLEASKALLAESLNQYSKSQVTTMINKIDQRIRALEKGDNL